MFHNKYTIIGAFVLGAFVAGGVVVYAATWQGTSSITNGRVIDPSIIKDNFDYLYEQVEAQKGVPEGYSLQYINSTEDYYQSWQGAPSNNYTDDTCQGGSAYNKMQPYVCAPNTQKNCLDIVTTGTQNGRDSYMYAKRNVSCKRAQGLIKN